MDHSKHSIPARDYDARPRSGAAPALTEAPRSIDRAGAGRAAGLQSKGNEMRMAIILALALLTGGAAFAKEPAASSNSCKICSDQQAACMKNYAGPTCKTEFQMCIKSCGKK
jgi:hypothetical protein